MNVSLRQLSDKVRRAVKADAAASDHLGQTLKDVDDHLKRQEERRESARRRLTAVDKRYREYQMGVKS